jgi:prolyl oligopeptidase
LGTEQSEDILIYSDPKNPNHHFGAAVTFDEKWIRMTISESTDPVNKLWLAKLDNKGLPANGTLSKV